MSNENSFHLASDLRSMLAGAKACLKEMEGHCEVQIPFHLSSYVESTVAVAKDCLEKMKDCFELSKKLAMLRLYEREGNLTKIMLFLTPYGSKSAFEDIVVNAMTNFHGRLKDLENYLKGIEAKLQAKRYTCPECQGSGSYSKWVYVRERGTPIQSILRSFHCDYCKGKGYLTITTEVQNSLTLFCEKANELALTFRNFHKSINLFNSACTYEKMRLEEIKEPEKRKVLQREWKAKPEEKGKYQKRVHVETYKEILKTKQKIHSWPYPKGFFLNLLKLKHTTYYPRSPDGTPTWLERKANRQYTCSTCKKIIQKGQRYIRRKKLMPGMRGPYGYRGTYVTDHYHIDCLLKLTKSEIEGKISIALSEISMLKNEISAFKNEMRLKAEQIEAYKALIQESRKEYEKSFWKKFFKWVSYHSISRSKNREILRLEKDRSHLRNAEIPERETRIIDLKKRISNLKSWSSEIQKRIREIEQISVGGL